MIDESMQLHGAMTLILRRASGEVETVHKDNIIVNAGFDFIADAIGKSASRPAVMGFIALGTGTTAAAASTSRTRGRTCPTGPSWACGWPP